MAHYAELAERLRCEPRRWLVTGVAGFIGSHLLENLLRLGQSVIGVDNFSTGHVRNLEDVTSRVGPAAARFELVEGDIRDLAVCRKAASGVDIVLHQAALGSVPRSVDDPLESHACNVTGFMNVLVAARDAGVERLVYASSSSVYGSDDASIKSEGRLGTPLSPYAVTKLSNELYARVFHDVYAFETVGLRYFNVFGPRQDPNGPYAAVIPRWTEHLFSGQECVVYGDPNKSRDFCYVQNVVECNLLAAGAAADNLGDPVFNVACGRRTTLLELFNAIKQRVAAYRPDTAMATLRHEPARAGDIAHSLADIERAKSSLGYRAEYDISRGLDLSVPWYAGKCSPEAQLFA